MIKALRMVKEKVAGPVGEADVEDRKRVKDIQDAALALQKTMAVFFKVTHDATATTAALHEDMANLYPAGQPLSTAVAALNAATSQQLFADAQAMIGEAKALLEPPVDKILARTRELLGFIEERHVVRSEVEHYKDKVTKLANEGLGDTKKQAKAESNQSKLLGNQKRLRELDSILGHAVPELDSEISGYCDKAIAGYVQLQANLAATSMNAYGAAIAAVPGAVRTGSGPTAGVLQPSKAHPEPAAEAAPAASGSLSDFLGASAPAPAPVPESEANAKEEPLFDGSGASATPAGGEGSEDAGKTAPNPFD